MVAGILSEDQCDRSRVASGGSGATPEHDLAAASASRLDSNFVGVLPLTCQRRAWLSVSSRTSIRQIFIDRRNYLAWQNAPGRNPNEP